MAWPSISGDLGNPPRLDRHVLPLIMVIGTLVFVLHLHAADQRPDGLPVGA